MAVENRSRTNWRLYADDLIQLKKDAEELGFGTVGAFARSLFRRYVRGLEIQRGKRFEGVLSKDKMPVNWVVNTEDLHQIEIEATALGYGTIPAFVNSFIRRYVRGLPIKRGDRLEG